MTEEKDVPITGSSNVDGADPSPAQPSFLDNNDSSAHSSVLKGDENGTVNVESVHDAEQATPPMAPREPYTAYTESRQMFIVLIATFVGIFAPICGAVYLPSLILFQDIFHVSGQVINATVSVYSAIFAVTPLFGAPASDYVGRKGVYLITLFIFLVSNTLLAAVPPTIGGLFVLRIFQAIGASVVTSVGAGTVADVTEPSKRASRMGIFLLGPNLGPVLGPLIGGQFSTPRLWRWIFGFLCKSTLQSQTRQRISLILCPGSYCLFPGLSRRVVLPSGDASIVGWERKLFCQFLDLARETAPAAETDCAEGRIPETTAADSEESIHSAHVCAQPDRKCRVWSAVLRSVLHLHLVSAGLAAAIRMEWQ
ncbi:hypothetical protein O1611_g337 [Lasiodiplodia mahajangana]|uniref:Uncharacterized protein n=1 Tax=Lasiodiplodia mahajangana TaxID=1108764 RepID=A0ACC2K0H7_9PEZI|nr:hypothetical protein O1611_g337 [Lasiodiplodia mahajangana]